MINSRYAPIVALSVLGIIAVLILGWFLAVKPQLDERAEISEMASEVEANTERINNESDRLDTLESELQDLPSYSDVIATHSPETFQVEDVRVRIAEAIREAGAEIVELEHAGLTQMDGWSLPANTLPSATVAALFQTGPVHPEGEHIGTDIDAAEPQADEYEPVVSVATDQGVSRPFYGVPITVTIEGTGQELLDVLEVLEDPEDQLFQLYALEFETRPEGSSPIFGVSDAVDGDALLVFTGFFYLEGIEREFPDNGEVGGVELGDIEPFYPIEGNVDQPGADGGGASDEETEDE